MALPPATLLLGTAKTDITCLVPGIGMYGWAMYYNRARRVHMPLHARAFVFRETSTGTTLVYVYAELAFITLSVRQGVLAQLAAEHPELGVAEQNLMLAANHTHSTPGGYSQYALYNITVGGYSAQVLDTIVTGMVQAIVQAHQQLQPVVLRQAEGRFADDIPVVFNRAWLAHSANTDTDTFAHADWHQACDRNMLLLRAEHAATGVPLAALNWFAVHTTTVHSEHDAITPDNNGWAAYALEQQLGGDFVAAFAQKAAGDATPNFRKHPGKKYTRGITPDDFENMRLNGGFQADKALELLHTAANAPAERPFLDSVLVYVNMGHIACDPAFTGGRTGCRTGRPVLGVSFMHGTREGEGVHGLLPWLCASLGANIRTQFPGYAEVHGPKKPVIDSVRQVFMGQPMKRIPAPGWLSPEVAVVREWAAADAFGPQPLTPDILPVQVFIIGSLAIAALPTEPTTQVGVRIARQLEAALAPIGVTKAVCGGYSNGYSGYTTTYEEYQLQGYEAGSTHFGQWTCAAYQTVLKQLCEELLKPAPERHLTSSVQPHVFDPVILARRAWKLRSGQQAVAG
jgi:neutral ceramidase